MKLNTISPAEGEFEDSNNTNKQEINYKEEVDYKEEVGYKHVVLDKQPILASIREEDISENNIEFAIIDKNKETNNIDNVKILQRSISDFDLNQE